MRCRYTAFYSTFFVEILCAASIQCSDTAFSVRSAVRDVVFVFENFANNFCTRCFKVPDCVLFGAETMCNGFYNSPNNVSVFLFDE